MLTQRTIARILRAARAGSGTLDQRVMVAMSKVRWIENHEYSFTTTSNLLPDERWKEACGRVWELLFSKIIKKDIVPLNTRRAVRRETNTMKDIEIELVLSSVIGRLQEDILDDWDFVERRRVLTMYRAKLQEGLELIEEELAELRELSGEGR